MTGFETVSTEVLLVTRQNLWQGLGKVGEHFIAGSATTPPAEKACTPAEFGGTLIAPLFFNVNTELVNRGESDWTGKLS